MTVRAITLPVAAILVAGALFAGGCSSADAGDDADATTTSTAADEPTGDKAAGTEDEDPTSEDEQTDREAPDAEGGSAIAELTAEWTDYRDTYTEEISIDRPLDEVASLLGEYRNELYLLDGAVRDVELADADLRRAVTGFQELVFDQIAALDALTATTLTAQDGDRVAVINAAVDSTVADLSMAAHVATGAVDPDAAPIGSTLIDLTDESTGLVPVAMPARSGLCGGQLSSIDPLAESGVLFQDAAALYGQRLLVFADEEAAAGFVEDTLDAVDDCVGDSDGDIMSTAVDTESYDDGAVVTITYSDGVPNVSVIRNVGPTVVLVRVTIDGQVDDPDGEARNRSTGLADELVDSL